MLNVRRRLRDVLEAVASELQLVFDVLRCFDVDAGPERDAADDLLAEEVPAHNQNQQHRNLNCKDYRAVVVCVYGLPYLHLPELGLCVLLQIHIDGEMRVHISHLVLESFRHADDQVVDEGADGAEGGDVFARPVVHFDVDEALARVAEADAQVAEVLGQFAPGTFDDDIAGLDFDCDCRCCVSVRDWWWHAAHFHWPSEASDRVGAVVRCNIPPSGISSSSLEWMARMFGNC